MILKAGTYRFNDELDFSHIEPLFQTILDSFVYVEYIKFDVDLDGVVTFDGFGFSKVPTDSGYQIRMSYDNSISQGSSINNATPVYSDIEFDVFVKGWLGEALFELPNSQLQTHTITQDTAVDETFGNWYISNTNYNEVNAKPLAEITYNGETIAQLNAGETATLSCEGKKMASDVVVKVDKGAGGSGNVVPLTAKQNGIYTYTYETATETIDVNTQWEFIMPETNDIVGFKKATNFIVPKSIEDVSSKLFYMSVPQEDGTIESLPFDEITQEKGFVFANMVLMYVGDATPLNEEYGTTYFENNTIYLTNAIWLIWIFAGGAIEEIPPITITFASKLIENASFYPVTVDVEPNLTTRTITTNGTYTPTSDKDGFSSVTVDVPAKVTVTNLPTGNADADDVYEMDGALYKLNTNVLTGAWTMSTDPYVAGLHNGNSYEVNFTCNGVEYTGFGYKYDNIDYKLYYQGPNAIEVYNTVKGWLNDSYRYIEITGENENVLAWLNGNGGKKTSGEWLEYIKPEGTLNILQNNTTYDVSQYAEVRIATAHPYEVPLEMLMNNVISDASQATIGNVYKYTGETTDTYENGTLYILEEVSE